MASGLELVRDAAPRQDDAALSVQDVSMTFGTGDSSQQVRALHKVDLEIRSGELVSRRSWAITLVSRSANLSPGGEIKPRTCRAVFARRRPG